MQDIVMIKGEYKIKYNNEYFDIDTTVVTIKAKNDKIENENYTIIRSNKLGYFDIQVPENVSVIEYIDSLLKDESLESIDYNAIGEYADFIPNDPQHGLQWHLPVINIFKAWDITTGSPDVIVAVLDSGTDWGHFELGMGRDPYQNIHLNQGEDAWSNPNNPITGNRIDDDNNRLIDDWKGWNYDTHTNDVRTTNPHGTFVSGIVAGKTNNNDGIAGVAGGNNDQGIQLLSYCVGIGAPLTAVLDDAIVKAVEMGARVIQLSLAVPQTIAIDFAIQYAIDNNVVVVCAAGNGSSASVAYPATKANVIAVGATDQDNKRASFSRYGIDLNIMATGEDIYSTTLNNGFDINYGTSFAAPQISGIIALMLSININLRPNEIKSILEITAQKEGGYDYQIIPERPNGSFNLQMGYGIVDAYEALYYVLYEWEEPSIIGPDSIELCGTYAYQFSPSSLSSEEYIIHWRVSDNLVIRSGQNTDVVEIEMVELPPLGESSCVYADVMRAGVVIYTLTKILNSSNSVTLAHNLSTEDFIISSNTTWSGSKILGVEATVAGGATLTITGSVLCTDNAAIVVQPSGKLLIDGGTLTALCSDSLWNGIVVLGNQNQPQLPIHQGTVELINGAVIEHALCGIKVGNERSSRVGGGGIIYADNATFRNNLVAIEYRPYENMSDKISQGNTVLDNVGKFKNCTFKFSGGNRFAANGKTFLNHVRMWEVRGITFEACYFLEEDLISMKLPAPVNYGINTMDAGFKVINYCKPGGAGSGIDCPCLSNYSTPSRFFELITGINSINTGTLYYIHIDQSRFRNIGTGVRINGQNDYRLTRNEFISTGTGLNSDNSSGYMIWGNNFYPFSGAFGTGISMNNSGGASNRIFDNDFTSLNTGIFIQGINGPDPNGYVYNPTLNGLQITQNTFTNNGYDMYIYQNATMRQHQGGQSSGANNKFINTGSSSIYSSNLQNAQSITYYHSSGNNLIPYLPTSNITIIGNALTPSVPYNPCDYGVKSGTFTDSITHYKMLQEQYDKLLAELKDNPEILQKLLILSDEMYELNSHAIHRILKDSVLYEDALKEWYDVIRTPVAKYSLAEAHFMTKDYEKADAVLKAMPEMFQFEKEEMEEHDNYLRFFKLKKAMTLEERSWEKLTDYEFKELEIIAQATCGRSASMAQGVLCFFYDNCKEYEKCQPEEIINPKVEEAEEEVLSINEHNELTIRPNPTNGELKIESGKLNVEKVLLFDVFGRQIFETSEKTFDISHLSRGVYIVKVYLENEEIITQKIVKQ
jgi:hypothetical protein